MNKLYIKKPVDDIFVFFKRPGHVKPLVDYIEAVAQRCSEKKVFLKFRKIHRKTSVPVSLF